MKISKTKLFLQISIFYAIVLILGWLSNNLVFNLNDNWIIVITCVLNIAFISLVTLKADQKPLKSIGLLRLSIRDILHGLALGVVLYLLQVLPPVLIMHMDISQYGNQFSILPFLARFIFLTITIGFSEEIIFRGFLFTKLNQLMKSKILVILASCILFYCAHLPGTLTIDLTHIYSTFVTTSLFCGYLYLSKKKTILPLLFAHGLLDTLIGGYGFVLWNFFFR